MPICPVDQGKWNKLLCFFVAWFNLFVGRSRTLVAHLELSISLLREVTWRHDTAQSADER